MQYREFCEHVARKASKMIMQGYTNKKSISYKEHDSIVTETDVAINKMVIDEIRQHCPDHDIQGEEESFLENNSEYRWICDPIDGTIPFTLGFPNMTFSLALVHNGKPIAAVCSFPIENTILYAEKGEGTWLNDEKQTVGAITKTLHIGFTEWHTSAHRTQGLYDGLVDANINLMDIGSIVLMGMLVAKGNLAAAVFTGDMQHDTPAIDLLITEAGGRTSDFAGNELDYRKPIYGFIGSNGECHDKILEIIKEKRSGA